MYWQQKLLHRIWVVLRLHCAAAGVVAFGSANRTYAVATTKLAPLSLCKQSLSSDGVTELPQVQPDEALATAHQLALEYQIWERPLGLAGVWGGLVRAWLDALLPDDAHVRCSGRVKLVVTEVRRSS